MQSKEVTTVIDIQQTHDWRPDKYQSCTRPAVIKRRSAASNGKDVVTVRLYNVMDNHQVKRSSKAQQDIHKKSSTTLTFARGQDCLVCIQNHSKVTHDTGQRAGNTEGGGHHKLDFQVAEAKAMPPVSEVVSGPDDCVDEVEAVA